VKSFFNHYHHLIIHINSMVWVLFMNIEFSCNYFCVKYCEILCEICWMFKISQSLNMLNYFNRAYIFFIIFQNHAFCYN